MNDSHKAGSPAWTRLFMALDSAKDVYDHVGWLAAMAEVEADAGRCGDIDPEPALEKLHALSAAIAALYDRQSHLADLKAIAVGLQESTRE